MFCRRVSGVPPNNGMQLTALRAAVDAERSAALGGFSFMTLILVPSQGEDLQVNAWNWRPTLQLLLAANVITEDDHELMGAQGCGGAADAEKASRIAAVVANKLIGMAPGERLLANLLVSREPRKLAVFGPGVDANVDENELYSTTYEWLETFARFCQSSGGFKVM